MRTARLLPFVASVVIAAAVAEAQPVLPRLVGTPAPGSQLLPCGQPEGEMLITSSTHLDPACTYRNSFEIGASDVVFDCRGATVEAFVPGDGRGIQVRANTDTALRNVTVRNCIVHGFQNNVRVVRQGFKDLLEGQEYVNVFERITVENCRLLDSHGSGAFVDGYVTDVRLRNLEIAGSGSVGVYLEAGSKDNLVTRCDIHDNGYGDVVPEGVLIDIGGTLFRYRSTGREGIAIDGSRNNRIIRNTLTHNSAGGIFLYKNCGENFTSKPNQWWTRRYGADGNRILRNTISDAENGVWIASRMAENQIFMDCSDPAYVNAGGVRIHEDFADDNVVARNRFVDVRYGVRVEDDGNQVAYNRFSSTDPTHQAVILGTQSRTTVLGRPVDGNSIRANRADIAGNATPYGWMHGHTDTVYRNNRAGSAAAALVETTPPPINPFLFVETFWLDGTPPPP